MVPWAPLSFTVLALTPMWCCSCSPSRVLGFACTNTEFTRARHRLRHAGLRAQIELCAPLPIWEGFTYALCKRMVPWPPLSFTVLALASMEVPRASRVTASAARACAGATSGAPPV